MVCVKDAHNSTSSHLPNFGNQSISPLPVHFQYKLATYSLIGRNFSLMVWLCRWGWQAWRFHTLGSIKIAFDVPFLLSSLVVGESLAGFAANGNRAKGIFQENISSPAIRLNCKLILRRQRLAFSPFLTLSDMKLLFAFTSSQFHFVVSCKLQRKEMSSSCGRGSNYMKFPLRKTFFARNLNTTFRIKRHSLSQF